MAGKPFPLATINKGGKQLRKVIFLSTWKREPLRKELFENDCWRRLALRKRRKPLIPGMLLQRIDSKYFTRLYPM